MLFVLSTAFGVPFPDAAEDAASPVPSRKCPMGAHAITPNHAEL